MTTLKTPEEASEYFRTVVDKARARIMVTEDRKHLAEVLCDLLEGEKKPLITEELTLPADHEDVPEEILKRATPVIVNATITQMQALIRQTLDPISNQE